MMMSASPIQSLFGGPSPGIVVGLLVVALGAAAAVLWTLVRLVVDPRASTADESDGQGLVHSRESGDTADEPSYAYARGDGSG